MNMWMYTGHYTGTSKVDIKRNLQLFSELLASMNRFTLKSLSSFHWIFSLEKRQNSHKWCYLKSAKNDCCYLKIEIKKVYLLSRYCAFEYPDIFISTKRKYLITKIKSDRLSMLNLFHIYALFKFENNVMKLRRNNWNLQSVQWLMQSMVFSCHRACVNHSMDLSL